MDKKNYQRVDLLEEPWKKGFGDNKEDPGLSEDFPQHWWFRDHKQTIRDWPEDVEMNDLLESDFQKVWYKSQSFGSNESPAGRTFLVV